MSMMLKKLGDVDGQKPVIGRPWGLIFTPLIEAYYLNGVPEDRIHPPPYFGIIFLTGVYHNGWRDELWNNAG
ncbi:MAG: hypothetical protein C7B46_13195 [Sulfobacillus benefaciens]|uniref:Uncharacterized protein n=1 Tax=Sulfobacillus benefaciens TaxID=453960 RepID=A0A2T2XDY6_9FIRM|nr:MAG: hypothetical protein C7B46_13195 [Sulfobacillus benefaciens]